MLDCGLGRKSSNFLKRPGWKSPVFFCKLSNCGLQHGLYLARQWIVIFECLPEMENQSSGFLFWRLPREHKNLPPPPPYALVD